MKNYTLAIDIGASSGRHILGSIENGNVVLEEVYRFENGLVERNGHLCWDLDKLFKEVKVGLKKCAELCKIPSSVGIDTWGVDFVLLDERDKVIGDTIAYRDSRTEDMDVIVQSILSKEELYSRTGIQKQPFNTIYQLMAIKQTQPQHLLKAENLLMIPDYLHFLLTGVKKQEYTNASTTQLLNAQDKTWDMELIKKLGFPKNLFKDLSMPGTRVGIFSETVANEVGFNAEVILPPTHDTASAVFAVPMSDNSVYISSGTWSLMGIESDVPNCSLESMRANFTNEGGYDYKFRYLKNIMGLWMIQCVKKEIGNFYSFADLCDLAAKETIDSIVDCNDQRFLSPVSMIDEIQAYCAETNQTHPQSPGQLAAVVYNSLAVCYKEAKEEIEKLMNKKFDSIYIVGGGANADYLNKLTCTATGVDVYAGVPEATAVGNLLAQMIVKKDFESKEEAKKCVFETFEMKHYKEEN